MGRIPISNSEKITKLHENISKIKLLCDFYDSGNFQIFEEIAVKLRVLFHATDRSKSLLQIAKLDHIKFVDTTPEFSPRNIGTTMGLLLMKEGKERWEYKANCIRSCVYF